MPPDTPPGDQSQFAEFLADYLVECDEHLSIARRSLLALEQSLEKGKVDQPLLDELFRNFHSIKGLSAMVGFPEAEQLAHHLESFLGVVRKNHAALDLKGLEGLIEGVTALEQVIAARRDAAAPPDLAALLDRIAIAVPVRPPGEEASADLKSEPTPAKPRDNKDGLIAEKIAAGNKAWRFTFSPSPELVARGVDVNSVRKKLQAQGEIVTSAPLIEAEGRISFTFVLVSSEPSEQIEACAGDGLTCVPYVSAPPPAPAPAGNGPALATGVSTHLTPGNVVRVDLQRLDELMRLVGELVLSRARLEESIRRLEGVAPPAAVRGLRETTAVIERQLRDLREGVMRVRMVPVREVFARMQFVVRDLMRDAGKQVTLKFSGEETQIDKYVVERIMDPLLHLVRNAVSHGLESPAERLAAKKPVEGQLHLAAHTTGEMVVIEVEDDGRGIDAEKVLAQAKALNLELPAVTSDTATLLDILCIPGFSTRKRSDRVSGRGIGMDVVRKSVEELGGSLTLQTSRGGGSRFEIQLPLTLAITDALIVKVATERFAIPQVAVREIIRMGTGTSVQIEKNELLSYRTGVLPLLRLSHLCGATTVSGGEDYVLVIGEGTQAIGIVVESVLGLREIVVRPLTDRLVQVPGVSGATELGDGRVVLILDTANLSRIIRKRSSRAAEAPLANLQEQSYVP